MKSITVIVPVYNAEKYIKKCIDSILAQPYKDLEILLIDDGSTDNSFSICDGYSKHYENINVIHKENGGVSSARNYALDHVISRWIMFVDADDWLEQGALPTELSFVLDDQTDIIEFSYIRGDLFVKKQEGLYKGSGAIDYVVNNFYNELWGRIFRLDLVANIRFNQALKVGEDILYLIEVYNKASVIRVVNTSGYHYYVNQDSVMRRVDESFVMQQEDLLAKYLQNKSLYTSNTAFAYFSKVLRNKAISGKGYKKYYYEHNFSLIKYLLSHRSIKNKVHFVIDNIKYLI